MKNIKRYTDLRALFFKIDNRKSCQMCAYRPAGPFYVSSQVIESVSMDKCSVCPFTNLTKTTMPWLLTPGSKVDIYCGIHDSPITEDTWTNELKVHFVTDNRISYPGFSMSYKAMDGK